MTIKRIPLLLVLALFTIAVVACELSASTPPPASPTSGGPMGTLQSELGNIATQTAAAGGSVGVPTSTETSPSVTGTSVPSTPPTATPEPTKVAVAQPTAGIPLTYTIQKGEFPFCIARRFNVNQTELLNINGLALGTKVVVGVTLKIPQTGNPFYGQRALRAHPATYTVIAGDSMFTIACFYGDVSPDAIAQANGISAPYALTAGQTLNIP